ncbi:acyl-CoA dehydrogenase family member 11-like [Chiloscyllium plagiosum]|uniref:acyl-CoA dehydrogenase family member 11-like n=1 Tax=Chiloscyllium plagiosum TaxID=36176 RepID=UPI001CB82BCA|nr:acyl-CoA dehydrogenase family member 11-like [Chiloscyllium plagiosum]
MADTTPVRNNHVFDEEAVERVLSAGIPGFPQDPGQPFTVRQYRWGQSNPTFRLQKGDKEYVLRKRPPGTLLKGAHQVAREYRVQKALFEVGFPVPKPLMFVDDHSIVGTDFYVMECVQVMFRVIFTCKY